MRVFLEPEILACIYRGLAHRRRCARVRGCVETTVRRQLPRSTGLEYSVACYDYSPSPPVLCCFSQSECETPICLPVVMKEAQCYLKWTFTNSETKKKALTSLTEVLLSPDTRCCFLALGLALTACLS